MIRRFMAALALAVLLLTGAVCPAGAEVFIDAEKPADWDSRDLLKITVAEFLYHDAMIFECGGKNMLLDGGTCMDWKRLKKYMDKQGIDHFNIMFNSHPHDDHIEGQYYLIRYGKVTADEFISPFPSTHRNKFQKQAVGAMKKAGIPYRQIAEGEKFSLGGAEMTLYRWDAGKEPNASSGVLYVRFGNATALMTADITGEAEHWFVEHYGPERLKCDIMKAPHHGPGYMVADFLNACDPQFVFITSTTYASKRVTEQLVERHQIPTMHNSKGTIFLETDGTDWYIRQEAKVM